MIDNTYIHTYNKKNNFVDNYRIRYIRITSPLFSV